MAGSKPDSGSSFLVPTKYESTLTTCKDDPNKYLARPVVYRNPQMVVDHESDGLKIRAKNIGGDELSDKIQKMLELLTLRDVCILIQFWLPCIAGNYTLLKTVDQPFGLGIGDERLWDYRRESEGNRFNVDEECKEEDLMPIVRVFRRRLAEWTSDVTNYYSKNHPLLDCAIRGGLHGYLVLPVFDSLTMLCVGVLESITSSRYVDCAYEVQEVHRTLKEANLTSPQAFVCSASHAELKNTQHELDEIFKILKDCCFTHKLPLAQTWKVSSTSSFVTTETNIEKTCSSFNSSCIGKVCMSTTGLPFYVHDLRFWPFREACREHHLLKSKGVVGRAFSSHGSCFCADVTKLEEDEYSLVHNARMINGLTSCLAIYLHSKEHEPDSYVLEFFLPADIKESADQQNLVQKLKLNIVKSSYFELGDQLSNEVIGTPMEISHCDFGMPIQQMRADDLIIEKNNVVIVEKGGSVKQRRKCKKDSLTLENIEQYFGNPIEEASRSLGVSRSTLKRVCRKFNIPTWPIKPNRNNKNVHFGIHVAVFLLVRVKRWSCSSNHHGFSGRWWICGKHNSFASKSNPSPDSELIRRPQLTSSQPLKQPDESPKKNINMMVTVKATYKEDMIKFRFPISSRLLELENQVAQRFKLKNTRLYLKYKDEDDDLILIACDVDLHNLMSFSGSNNTIKLIVQIA